MSYVFRNKYSFPFILSHNLKQLYVRFFVSLSKAFLWYTDFLIKQMVAVSFPHFSYFCSGIFKLENRYKILQKKNGPVSLQQQLRQ